MENSIIKACIERFRYSHPTSPSHRKSIDASAFWWLNENQSTSDMSNKTEPNTEDTQFNEAKTLSKDETQENNSSAVILATNDDTDSNVINHVEPSTSEEIFVHNNSNDNISPNATPLKVAPVKVNISLNTKDNNSDYKNLDIHQLTSSSDQIIELLKSNKQYDYHLDYHRVESINNNIFKNAFESDEIHIENDTPIKNTTVHTNIDDSYTNHMNDVGLMTFEEKNKQTKIMNDLDNYADILLQKCDHILKVVNSKSPSSIESHIQDNSTSSKTSKIKHDKHKKEKTKDDLDEKSDTSLNAEIINILEKINHSNHSNDIDNDSDSSFQSIISLDSTSSSSSEFSLSQLDEILNKRSYRKKNEIKKRNQYSEFISNNIDLNKGFYRSKKIKQKEPKKKFQKSVSLQTFRPHSVSMTTSATTMNTSVLDDNLNKFKTKNNDTIQSLSSTLENDNIKNVAFIKVPPPVLLDNIKTDITSNTNALNSVPRFVSTSTNTDPLSSDSVHNSSLIQQASAAVPTLELSNTTTTIYNNELTTEKSYINTKTPTSCTTSTQSVFMFLSDSEEDDDDDESEAVIDSESIQDKTAHNHHNHHHRRRHSKISDISLRTANNSNHTDITVDSIFNNNKTNYNPTVKTSIYQDAGADTSIRQKVYKPKIMLKDIEPYLSSDPMLATLWSRLCIVRKEINQLT